MACLDIISGMVTIQHGRSLLNTSPISKKQDAVAEMDCLVMLLQFIILKKRIPRTLDYSMQEYIFNVSRCRWDVLFGRFESYVQSCLDCKCMCCDGCSSTCGCDCLNCVTK